MFLRWSCLITGILFCLATQAQEAFKSHFPDGTLASQGYFVDGKKHGYWQYWSPSGDLWMQVLYLKGKKQSDANYLETSPEQPEMNRCINLSADTLTGNDYWYKHLIFYSDSLHPYDIGDVYVLRNTYISNPTFSFGSKKKGLYIEHYLPNPQHINADSLYEVDKRLLGDRIKDERLVLNRSLVLKNDLPFELYLISKNESIGPHHLKKGEGLYTACHPDGSKWMEVSFINGKPHGAVHYYGKNESIELAGWYLRGKRSGKWTFYYPNGKVHRQLMYSDGRFTGGYRSYYKNGNTRMKAIFQDGDLGTDPTDPLVKGSIFDGLPTMGAQPVHMEYFTKDGQPSYRFPVAMVHETMYHKRRSRWSLSEILRGSDGEYHP